MSMIPVRDVSLFVKVMGRGEPLLLMHGGPGLDHSTLSSLAPLADQLTLIFYDHRCNGRSTGAVDSMTFENLTADADALRQTLGFDEWSVLGHSFGGLVALEYALRYPERLARLLLLDTCADARWVQETAPAILAKRGYRPAAVRAARRFYGGELPAVASTRAVMRFVGAYYFRMGPLAWLRAVVEGPRIRMRREARVFGFAKLYPGWTVMDLLHQIGAPTLVMAGRYDFLSPAEHNAIVAERIPHAQLEIIERAGHCAHDERRREVLAILRRFMAAGSGREARADGYPGRAPARDRGR